MQRRALLATLAATLPLAGCSSASDPGTETPTTPQPVEAELRINPSGFSEYNGTVSLTDAETGETLVSDEFSYVMNVGTPDEDGVQTGITRGGGFHYPTVRPNATYEVTVTVEESVEEQYVWTPTSEYGLVVQTTADSVTFEESEKWFDTQTPPTSTD